ncbi:MAG: hypothetical protein ACPG4T_18790, partial [Nannocystaceae bacterium]
PPVPEETEPEISPAGEVAAKVDGEDGQTTAPDVGEHEQPGSASSTGPYQGSHQGQPQARGGPSRGAGLLAVGVLIWAIMVVLVLAMGGSFEAPTIALGVGGIALIFAIWRLFRMVAALSETPEYGLEGSRTQGEKTRRQDEFQRLLRGLKELEFDHEMGKISEHDFSSLEQAYRARALDLMQALELEKQAGDGSPGLHPALQKELDRRAREVRLSFSGSDLKLDATPKKAQPGVAEKACGKCDGHNDPDAKFCKHCGQGFAA